MSLDVLGLLLGLFSKITFNFPNFPIASISAIFFFTLGSAITITFVLSKPIPQIAKVAAILEFFGNSLHAFLAVDLDKITSFFIFFNF